jgi:hypothetical protein
VKRGLKAGYYIRYADDFVLLSRGIAELFELIPKIDSFLKDNLKLSLHPGKVFIKTLASGVDFLGWVHFPDHRVLRTATKKRMLRRRRENSSNKKQQSYLGLLKHGNTNKIRRCFDLPAGRQVKPLDRETDFLFYFR